MGPMQCSMCNTMHGQGMGHGMGHGTPSPVEISIKMWQKSFFEAMNETMKEKLKKKIEASWGPMMDKEADLILEAMGKQWMAIVQMSASENELREKIIRLMSEAQKEMH